MSTLFEQPLVEQVVGPELAATWLRTVASGHRPASAVHITRFQDIIAKGHWYRTPGDPILFDTLGRLRGGRVRLEAITRSGKQVPLFVLLPPPPQPHETIPGVYADAFGDKISAVRWDGGNLDAVIDLVDGIGPGGKPAWAAQNEDKDLILQHHDGTKVAIIPGDWLKVMGTLIGVQHHDFVQAYTYQGPLP